MGLNKAKGNMYEFITHTWNTIKGKCYHDCSYCYMKRFGKQNPVRFDKKELKTDLGSGNYIFVGSSCDMWAEDIPDAWIDDTLEHCTAFANKYFFQTKNPGRLLETGLPYPSEVCVTIETNRYYPEIMQKSPPPSERAYALKSFRGRPYITIEPIMDFDLSEFVDMLKSVNPKQVNIGADTGKHDLPEPSPEKVLALIDELKKFTIVHTKNNLKRILEEKND